jgi:hypothetical protein
METSSYSQRQEIHDREYEKAWADAPDDFKKGAEALGLKCKVESKFGNALEFHDNILATSHTPDMADLIDTHVDRLIEKYGVQYADLINDVAKDLREPMEAELHKRRALLLAQVAGYLVKTPTRNILARVHQLLHAIPRLASSNGYHSMRQSARECGVSVEWIRRGRREFCEALGLPIPVENKKSEIAKRKYSKSGKDNHWRNQIYTTQKRNGQKVL